MTITYDRKNQGSISLFIDGQFLANDTLSIIASPKIGQEIWINAREWDQLDTGFRGTLNRFAMYADALPPQVVAAPISSSLQTPSLMFQFKSTVSSPHLANSSWALFLPCVILTMIFLFFLRKRKGVLANLPESAGKFKEIIGNTSGLVLSWIQKRP